MLRWGRDHKPMQGTIVPGGFSATRIIHYRNSFLPVITGTFGPTPDGTLVHLRMMPHVLVLIFMAIWLSLAGMFFLLLVATGFQTGEWSQALVPAGMFVFGILLCCGAFHAEAGKGRRLVTPDLTAEPAPPIGPVWFRTLKVRVPGPPEFD